MGWHYHQMPKACSSCVRKTNKFEKMKWTGGNFDKYLMHTYQASVRAQVKGRSQVIKTEIRAMSAQDARWLLWAQFGFHAIESGPSQIKNPK